MSKRRETKARVFHRETFLAAGRRCGAEATQRSVAEKESHGALRKRAALHAAARAELGSESAGERSAGSRDCAAPRRRVVGDDGRVDEARGVGNV